MAGDNEAGWVPLNDGNPCLVGIDFIDAVKKMPKTTTFRVLGQIDDQPNRYQITQRGGPSILFEIVDSSHIQLLGYRGVGGLTPILAYLDGELQFASSIGNWHGVSDSDPEAAPVHDLDFVKKVREVGPGILRIGTERYQISSGSDRIIVKVSDGAYQVQGYKIAEDKLEGSVRRIREALGLS